MTWSLVVLIIAQTARLNVSFDWIEDPKTAFQQAKSAEKPVFALFFRDT